MTVSQQVSGADGLAAEGLVPRRPAVALGSVGCLELESMQVRRS